MVAARWLGGYLASHNCLPFTCRKPLLYECSHSFHPSKAWHTPTLTLRSSLPPQALMAANWRVKQLEGVCPFNHAPSFQVGLGPGCWLAQRRSQPQQPWHAGQSGGVT